MQITLSGGNFGGIVVSWIAGDTELRITDQVGIWVYKLEDSQQSIAVFYGMA